MDHLEMMMAWRSGESGNRGALKPSNEPSRAATLYRIQFIFSSTSIQCKVCAFVSVSALPYGVYLYLCVPPRHFKHAKSEFDSKSEFEFSSPARQSLDSTEKKQRRNKKIKRKSINAKIPKETILMVKVQQSQPPHPTANIQQPTAKHPNIHTSTYSHIHIQRPEMWTSSI